MAVTNSSTGVPLLGLPYRVLKFTLVVEIECQQCREHVHLYLTNTQEVTCPTCGSTYTCGGMRWDIQADRGIPKLKIAATPPQLQERTN